VIVYAKSTHVVAWSNGRTSLTKGDAWESTSDFVRERPDLFTKEAPEGAVKGVRRKSTPPITTVTRAPGETRKGSQR